MAFLFGKKKARSFTEKNDASLNKRNHKNFLVRASSLIKGISDNRENFTAPEYNLYEIKIASESDSYIKMALMKYSYMLFKAGYMFKSENEKAADYVKQRLYIMSFATKKPIDILFQEVGDDLIKYSNAFLVKSRVDKVMPGVKATGFFKDKPIGGYFRIDPASIAIQRDKYGTIKKYIQNIDGEEKLFDPEDVIHFYLDKEAANAFGTPRIIAALEDVKLLRRIEGNIITMIYRFSMPLFQWIVGLPQVGFQATDKEIEQVKREIDNMSLDGSVVTNEKTNVKVVGAEGNALDAQGYLDYFEKRVFAALGVSESQMGRGGAKQDADSMESQAHDTVKHIQKVFSIFVENYIINELLLEGGFNPILNVEDRVQFVFNEINIETKIKVENHEMAKYQSNMISFEEMRREIGMREEVDESSLYKNKIEVKADAELCKIKGDESIRIVKNTKNLELRNSKELSNNSDNEDSATTSNSKSSTGSGSKAVSPNGNGNNKSQAPNNDISNKNTPENQFGKTSVKIKEGLNFEEKTIRNKKKHKKTFSNIYKKYYNLRNDIKEKPEDIDILIPVAYNNILTAIKSEIQTYSFNAIDAARKDISKLEKENISSSLVKVQLTYIEDMVEKDLKKILSDIQSRLKDVTDKNLINAVFDTLEYRIRFMLEYILPKAYWYSYIKTGESLGYSKAHVDFDGSKDSEEHSSIVDLKSLNIDDIPPYHPFCDCKIIFMKGDK